MSGTVADPQSEGEPAEPGSRSRWGAGAAVLLVEGTCAAVVAAFLATESIPVTIIAAAMAVLIVALVLGYTRSELPGGKNSRKSAG